jgi:pimeloyl-ACP methyl ester carboxylesterase
VVGAPEEQRFSVAAGVELHAEVWTPHACAHPVAFVLVHGLASNAAMWRGVGERLRARGHVVVAVDQRGHGRSAKPDGPYDVATFAADLAELLGALPLRRPAVAGQSFGGNVVLELAARRPELVRGVACVDGGWIELSERFSSWEACESELAPPVLEGRGAQELRALFRDSHGDWPEPGIEGLLANFEVREDGTVAPWLSQPRHLQILRSLWEHRPSQLYPLVRVPVLLVPAVNADQPEGWDETVDKAAELLPIVRLEPMAGDHDLHAQHPEAMADLLHEWADSSL